MEQSFWMEAGRKILLCIDDYRDGVPCGRLCNATLDAVAFSSLSQLLIKTDSMLDELQAPQAYTQVRTFSKPSPSIPVPPSPDIRTGKIATFELQVIFRQHTSWQGILVWLDQNKEQSFRSVLELIVLLDSALRS